MQKEVTLYCPAKIDNEGNTTILYKNVKNFAINNNGTVTFETTEHGKITTPLLWRLKEVEGDAPVSGNRGSRRGY